MSGCVATCRPAPCAGKPQRPDPYCAVGLPGRRLRVPGRARPGALAGRGACRRAARPAPRDHRAQCRDHVGTALAPSRRGAPAGARSRSDQGLPHQPGADRNRRPALDAGVPVHLLPAASLARNHVAGRWAGAAHHDPADRAGEPRTGAGSEPRRGHARRAGRGRPSQ